MRGENLEIRTPEKEDREDRLKSMTMSTIGWLLIKLSLILKISKY